ncbi:hypothetical protein MKW94_013907 [Papaver nudicaule]|uniref:Endopeptidase Clp n=1 Tax=Papaver nudicaule TaxID=74823 RepID=A0AA41W151_PAPNU|nr:hypothetical protein [Papaver nudicaule]
MYDTMQFVQPDVHTICMGLAASMGSFVLVGGEITKPSQTFLFSHHTSSEGSFQYFCSRFHSRAVCNAQKMLVRVMIHQPASSFYEAQTGEFVLEAEELLKLRETLTRVYVQRTGNPLWVVSEDMERDRSKIRGTSRKSDRSKPAHSVYDPACQLLNNLLETQDSQSEMSQNPPPFGDVLSVEEHVLGCMCDSFRS